MQVLIFSGMLSITIAAYFLGKAHAHADMADEYARLRKAVEDFHFERARFANERAQWRATHSRIS